MLRLGLRNSIATRLALGNGAMLAAMILVISTVFYFGTVGVLDRSIDGKIRAISSRLVGSYGARPTSELAQEINQELADGIDSDSEIFLVTSASGVRLVGNLSRWPDAGVPYDRLINRDVVRDGRRASARLIVQPLPHGGLLYVGRDLSEQRSIRALVLRALELAALISLGLVVIGAFLFRSQIEGRISDIRHTASDIEAGNLKSRIAISGDDEFARLSIDVNRMLDRIEQLMSGVRNVSNAIAHDLRTPLTRVRNRLDEALRRDRGTPALAEAARAAIEGIDDLILVFNKLLQIAEAEAGVRTRSFDAVDLSAIGRDMVELYDAAAEERGVRVHMAGQAAVWARGDHDLLASAVASLIDNAIKYAGRGHEVILSAQSAPATASITVQDDGPGVPQSELARLGERFYRLDQARSEPGNGLGLAIVSAIATLHGGTLQLSDARPGLRASIQLPAAEAPEGTRAAA